MSVFSAKTTRKMSVYRTRSPLFGTMGGGSANCDLREFCCEPGCWLTGVMGEYEPVNFGFGNNQFPVFRTIRVISSSGVALQGNDKAADVVDLDVSNVVVTDDNVSEVVPDEVPDGLELCLSESQDGFMHAEVLFGCRRKWWGGVENYTLSWLGLHGGAAGGSRRAATPHTGKLTDGHMMVRCKDGCGDNYRLTGLRYWVEKHNGVICGLQFEYTSRNVNHNQLANKKLQFQGIQQGLLATTTPPPSMTSAAERSTPSIEASEDTGSENNFVELDNLHSFHVSRLRILTDPSHPDWFSNMLVVVTLSLLILLCLRYLFRGSSNARS